MASTDTSPVAGRVVRVNGQRHRIPAGATNQQVTRLMSSLKRATPPADAGDWRGKSRAAATRHGVNPNLFESLVERESGFNPNAVGTSGEIGLAQLMPDTAAEFGPNVANPDSNLDYGARYLKQQIGRFGSERRGVSAYNAGPNGGIPESTQRYTDDVMAGAVPPDAMPGVIGGASTVTESSTQRRIAEIRAALPDPLPPTPEALAASRRATFDAQPGVMRAALQFGAGARRALPGPGETAGLDAVPPPEGALENAADVAGGLAGFSAVSIPTAAALATLGAPAMLAGAAGAGIAAGLAPGTQAERTVRGGTMAASSGATSVIADAVAAQVVKKLATEAPMVAKALEREFREAIRRGVPVAAAKAASWAKIVQATHSGLAKTAAIKQGAAAVGGAATFGVAQPLAEHAILGQPAPHGREMLETGLELLAINVITQGRGISRGIRARGPSIGMAPGGRPLARRWAGREQAIRPQAAVDPRRESAAAPLTKPPRGAAGEQRLEPALVGQTTAPADNYDAVAAVDAAHRPDVMKDWSDEDLASDLNRAMTTGHPGGPAATELRLERLVEEAERRGWGAPATPDPTPSTTPSKTPTTPSKTPTTPSKPADAATAPKPTESDGPARIAQLDDLIENLREAQRSGGFDPATLIAAKAAAVRERNLLVSKFGEPKVGGVAPATLGGGAEGTAAARPKFSRKMFRGSGRADAASVYGEFASGPVFGEGSYYAEDRKDAEEFGPNVEESEVELQNPLVIRSDADFKRAFGVTPDIITTAQMKAAKEGTQGDAFAPRVRELTAAETKRLRQVAEEAGHDGVVIEIHGDDGKRLRETFGHNQAIVFANAPTVASLPPPPPAVEEPAEAPRETTGTRNYKPGEWLIVPYSGRSKKATHDKGQVQGYTDVGGVPHVTVLVRHGKKAEIHNYPESMVRRTPKRDRRSVEERNPRLTKNLRAAIGGDLDKAREMLANAQAVLDRAHGAQMDNPEIENRAYNAQLRKARDAHAIVQNMVWELERGVRDDEGDASFNVDEFAKSDSLSAAANRLSGILRRDPNLKRAKNVSVDLVISSGRQRATTRVFQRSPRAK